MATPSLPPPSPWSSQFCRLEPSSVPLLAPQLEVCSSILTPSFFAEAPHRYHWQKMGMSCHLSALWILIFPKGIVCACLIFSIGVAMQTASTDIPLFVCCSIIPILIPLSHNVLGRWSRVCWSWCRSRLLFSAHVPVGMVCTSLIFQSFPAKFR